MRRVAAVLVGLMLAGGYVGVVQSSAGAATATFTSTQIGTSGSSPFFSMSGAWTLSWNYNCANFGQPGNFIVTVNQPAGDLAPDMGVNELSMSGSGTDFYYDTGSFNLSINSECAWSITVAPSEGVHTLPTTYTSTATGTTGTTQQFRSTGQWNLAWSYNCANFGQSGNFIVNVNGWTGTTSSADTGVNQLAPGGSGTETYGNAGLFNLSVQSECDWSITVSGAGAPPPPTPTPPVPTMVGVVPDHATGGYWEVASNGGVFSFNAPFYGSMGGQHLNQPIVCMAATPTGGGYWLVARDGGIFAFGNARFLGSMGGQHLNQPIVGIAPTPTGGGYWEVASDGGIFTFGNAQFEGSMGGQRLNQPIVGMATDTATGGYWEVASDGGIFSFNAPFYGSTGAIRLNKPIVGMSASPTGGGYRFVASDGGIFDFGAAAFEGSMGGQHLNAPVVGMATTSSNGGYWEVASDGGIFTFGNAQFFGSQG